MFGAPAKSEEPKKEEEPEQELPVATDPPKVVEAEKTIQNLFYTRTVTPRHKLALRFGPAFVKVSKNAWEDNDKKGKLLLMMPNETLLKVIEPHLGYNCEWHQVEILDDNDLYDNVKEIQKTRKLYAYAEFIHPSKGTPKPIPVRCQKCTDTATTIGKRKDFPDWTRLTECDPFYDRETCTYFIVIPLDDEKTSDGEIEAQKKTAIDDGIPLLFDFFDKQFDEEYVARLKLDKAIFVPTDGVFLDERPGSKLKILVAIPGKYFDTIPRRTDRLEDIPNSEGGRIPFEWKVTHFYTSQLKKNIDIVIKRFGEYAKDIKKWQGNRVEVDLEEEGKRLRLFPFALETLMNVNGYQFREDHEDTVEIGFSSDPCFDIVYVTMNQTGVMVPLRIGFNCFLLDEPNMYQRTMGYLFYLEEMVQDIKREKRDWISFVQSYTTCPFPEIIPSPVEIEETDEDIDLEYLGEDDPPYKTTTQKRKEDDDIDKQREKIHLKRRTERDFIGDELLTCDKIMPTINSINRIEDLYFEIMNKAHIGDLASIAASCLLTRFLPPDIRALICRMALDKIDMKILNSIVDFVSEVERNDIFKALTIHEENPSTSQILDKTAKMRTAVKDVLGCDRIYDILQKLRPTLIEELLRKLTSYKVNEAAIDRLKNPLVLTINLPDNLRTEDILASIMQGIEDTIMSVLSETLMSIVKELVNAFCSLCNPNTSPMITENYGDENIPEVLQRSGKDPIQVAKRIFKGCSQDDIGLLKDLLDDISSILLPTEICDLLNGEAGIDTYRAIQQLIRKKYPKLLECFSGVSKIKTLFLNLGKFVDPNVCDDIRNRPILTDENACSTRTDDPFRTDLLSGKMSAKQIEEQLDQKKKRDQEKVARFLQLVDEDDLGKMFSSEFNSCLDTAQTKLPFMKDPESLEYMTDKLYDSAFNGVEYAFDTDIGNFVPLLINKDVLGTETNFKDRAEDYEKAHDAKLKDLSEISQYTDVLMKELNSMGGTKNTDNSSVPIMPSLKKLLLDKENFYKKDHNKENLIVQYSLKANLDIPTSAFDYMAKSSVTDNTKMINAATSIIVGVAKNEEAKKKEQIGKLLAEYNMILSFGTNMTEEQKKRLAELASDVNKLEDIPQSSGVSAKVFGSSFSDPSIKDEEQKNNQTEMVCVDFTGVEVDPNSIIGTFIDFSIPESKENKDYLNEYTIVVNDRINDEYITLKGEEKVSEEIKVALDNMKITKFGGSTFQQDVFANLIIKAISPTLNNDGKQKLNDANSKFQKYIKSNCFQNITETLIEYISQVIASSPLFDRDTIKKMNFNSDQNSQQETTICEPFVRDSLLFVQQAKEKTKEEYEKQNAICIEDKTEDFNLMENTAMNTVVELYVRLLVVESILKGIFAFSQFDIENLTNNDVFSNYLLEKIKIDLRKENYEFYSDFLSRCKDYYESTGRETIDATAQDPDNTLTREEEKIKNEPIDPDVLNGTMALAYIVKSQIRFTSQEVKKYLKFTPVDIHASLFGNYIKEVDVFYDSGEAKTGFLNDNKDGGFVLERYVRLCETGEVRKPIEVMELSSKQQKYVVGIRLSYICSPSGIEKEVFDDVYKDLIDSKTPLKEKAYILYESIEHHPGVYTIPLLTIEDDTAKPVTHTVAMSVFQNSIGPLKEMMLADDRFLVLFDFALSLDKLIPLLSIYSIESVENSVKNISGLFLETKKRIKMLFNVFSSNPIDSDDWWKKFNPDFDGLGGNLGIRKKMMENVTTDGCRVDLLKIAMQTIPLIVKGMAGSFDECYKLIQKTNLELNYGSVPIVVPVNIFGPLGGFGPPIGPWGIIALALELLSGEKKEKDKKDLEKLLADQMKLLGEKKKC